MAALALCFGAEGATAEKYPVTPVRLIVPFPPGAGADVVGRVLARKLTENWGVQVVVDNRAGGGGTLGAGIAARAAPDGYTLMMGSIASLGTAQGLFKELSYDPVRDFTSHHARCAFSERFSDESRAACEIRKRRHRARAGPARQAQLFVVGRRLAQPPRHGAFQERGENQSRARAVPGPAEALNALVMNEVQVEIQSMLSATPFVQSNRVRLLATTGSQRMSDYRDVPTVAEAAVPGFSVYTWFGIVAPAGVPARILASLHHDVASALESAEMRKQFANQGAEVVANRPHEFAAFLKEEVESGTR
jgi:tripartite-type tricarboxylate transporter receptor subunit TctC